MPRPLRLRPLAALAACAALAPAVAACGGAGGNPDADPAAIVPARAPVYLEATINPEGDLDAAVNELGRKLAGVDDVGAELRRLIEREAREDDKDFSWKEDVEPWLGDRVGMFFHDLQGADDEPEGAVVFTTKDADKAREALEGELGTLEGGRKGQVVERTHRDVKYKVEREESTALAIVDDYAIFGDEAGVKAAIDASEAESLAEADTFKRSRDQVPTDGLGFGYIGLRQVFSQLGPEAAALRPLLESAGDSVALALTAEKDLIRLDSASLGVTAPGGTGPGEVLADLPGDAWMAIGTADLGATLERTLTQVGQLGALGGVDIQREFRRQTGLDLERDVIGWMGDAGIFMTGSSLAELGGGVVIASTDTAATRRAIPRIARAVAALTGASVGPAPRGVDAGAVLRVPSLPLPIALALDGDRFVVAVGESALASVVGGGGGTLAENPAFRTAQDRLGDGMQAAFFVDMGPVRELASAAGLEQQGEAGRRLLQALDAIVAVAAGGRRDGETARGRLVIPVK